MYGSPLGRPTGVVHLVAHHWKAVLCLTAVGFTVVGFNKLTAAEQKNFVPLSAIEAYCKDPAHPPLPLSAAKWKKLTKGCVCLVDQCPAH
jgi:hypothetical protein